MMNNKRIVYETLNGISILIPNPNCGLTLEQIIEKDIPKGSSYTILEKDDLPKTREHRDCWKLSGGKVEVCEIKKAAKEAALKDKADKKNSLLSKLKIDENEAKELGSIIKGR